MYADDATLFCDFDIVNTTEVTTMNELVKLREWMTCNQLSLKVTKAQIYSIPFK